MSMII